MFTGLIEAVCRVSSVRSSGAAMRLTVDLASLAEDTRIGDSVAINGACLTVMALQGTQASFDLSPETLSRSCLGNLRVGSQVNVERAVRPSDRLGGHIVQGHVDGTAAVKSIDRQGQFADIKFSAEAELLDQIIVKGSVAVDGISLTIAAVDQSWFTVAVIPQTLQATTLGTARIGDVMNVEVDVISKIVRQHLERMLGHSEKLTLERLKELGF